MKPILFNTEMVRAIIEGRKVETRRLIKPQPIDKPIVFYDDEVDGEVDIVCHIAERDGLYNFFSKYNIGDILYVQETWKKVCAAHKKWINGESFTCEEEFGFQYEADGEVRFENFFEIKDGEFDSTDVTYSKKWNPSIHMPKEAARIFLKVTNIRVERLQDIDNEGARKEGCDGRCDCPSNGAEGVLSCITKDFSVEKFQTVWDSTIKKSEIDRYGWNANPYVWVIEFEKLER